MPFRRRQPAPPPAAAWVPAGQRLYAVGDIHGRRDLLDRLLDTVREDAARAPDMQHTLIFLGDYIDRGLDSRGVIERLLADPPTGFGAIHLKGNHEDALLHFLDDPIQGGGWLRHGGEATLYSYGIRRPRGILSQDAWLGYARDALAARLPPDHLAFLRHLRPYLTVGDYLFVHAGIRPRVPLASQREEDLLWIRESFLESKIDHGHMVVHGHTVVQEPEIRPNRIGIDTGAFATGRLTALVLEGQARRFLSTGWG